MAALKYCANIDRLRPSVPVKR